MTSKEHSTLTSRDESQPIYEKVEHDQNMVYDQSDYEGRGYGSVVVASCENNLNHKQETPFKSQSPGYNIGDNAGPCDDCDGTLEVRAVNTIPEHKQ